jgi:uncharacterized SAM-binding protein YcdF (DUF218 family)
MDTLFFWVAKLVWSVIQPESLLLILILLAWVMLKRGANRWAGRVLGALSIAMVLTATLPVGEWILYPLEIRFPANPVLPQRIDGIIVLGGAEDAVRSKAWSQVETNESAERFLASLALSRRYPQAKLLFTSGSGDPASPEVKGADVAKRLYAEQGLDASKVLFESQSRNTAENVALSKALIKPLPGETWILVTSASHMPRAVGVFCKAGWQVLPYPVDHHSVPGHLLRPSGGITGNLDDLSTATREWVGLAAYFLTGRTSALFPDGCAT